MKNSVFRFDYPEPHKDRKWVRSRLMSGAKENTGCKEGIPLRSPCL